MMPFLEFLPTQSRDISRSTRIGSRGISRPDKSHIFGNQEFHFGAFDSAMVIPTWRKGSPCGVFPVHRIESQSVLGLDFSDFAPTQLESVNWVLNDDSVFTNEKAGSVNYEVDKTAKDYVGNTSKNDVFEVCSPEGLGKSSRQEQISHPSGDNRSLWSKEVRGFHYFTVLGIGESHG